MGKRENSEPSNVYQLRDYMSSDTSESADHMNPRKFELSITELELMITSLEKEIGYFEKEKKYHYQLDLLKELRNKLLHWIQLS